MPEQTKTVDIWIGINPAGTVKVRENWKHWKGDEGHIDEVARDLGHGARIYRCKADVHVPTSPSICQLCGHADPYKKED